MNFPSTRAFMEHLTAWRIPGNTITVFYRGKEIFSFSSGYADLEGGHLMQGSELFNIYSCTKVATVTAALQLLEQGLFTLETPLYDIFPAFRHMLVRNEDGTLREAKAPITLWNLFTMTAGFAYDWNGSAVARARTQTNGEAPLSSVVNALAEEPLYFEPSSRWAYSLCHDVLGGVIETVSGESLGKYMKNHVFSPIGALSPTFIATPETEEKTAAQYRFAPQEEKNGADLVADQQVTPNGDGEWVNVGKACAMPFGSAYESGGSGIISSVFDMALLADALANGGLAHNGIRILAPETVTLLHQNQLSDALLPSFNWAHLRGYGYGLGVRTMMDAEKSGSSGSVGEFGWGGAAGATLLADPETGLSYFYAHHMLNPQEAYYQPRLRDAVYEDFKANFG